MTQDEKREFLRQRGWSLWYSQENWVHEKTVLRPKEQDCTNYGMNTNRAYEFEVNNEAPFPPIFEGIVYGRQWKPVSSPSSSDPSKEQVRE